MRSYGLFVDGQEREGQSWLYTVKASALIADPAGAFELKRSLELGAREYEDAPAEVVGRVALGGDRDNAEALEAAARARRVYGQMPLEDRRAMGDAFHAAMLACAEDLVEILVAEGHPRRLAEWEIRGIIDNTTPETMDWCFGQLRSEAMYGERRIVLNRKPDGVVCLNPPQNAAGSNAALGFYSLLAGNTLVVKAPKATPLGVMYLYREIVQPLLERFGAPPGTLNLISGDTRKIIKQWTRSPLVDDIMFFGDSSVGMKIGADTVAAGKKAVLELSGNDGIVVWRDADLDAAAAAMCECFYGSSQICMVPKYAVVHPEIANDLIARVLDRVSEIRPGYPEEPDVVLSPVLKADRFFDHLAEAREAGARILTGGRRIEVDGEPSALGLFIEPTVVRVEGLETTRELACVREETFFPLLPILVPNPSDDLLERIIAFLNANEYGLRNSLWAEDDAVVEAWVAGVHNAGLLKVNESHIGFAPVLATHGGTGLTGGPYGELHYPILRTSHLQGAAVAPSGMFRAADLQAQISLPDEARSGNRAIG